MFAAFKSSRLLLNADPVTWASLEGQCLVVRAEVSVIVALREGGIILSGSMLKHHNGKQARQLQQA